MAATPRPAADQRQFTRQLRVLTRSRISLFANCESLVCKSPARELQYSGNRARYVSARKNESIMLITTRDHAVPDGALRRELAVEARIQTKECLADISHLISRMLFRKGFMRIVWFFAGLLLMAPRGHAQEAAEFFQQNCVSCHTVGGGRLTGPDLKNVTQRKEREWLVEFLQNPQAMMDKGDPYALKLQQEARGVVMPTPGGMSKDRAQAILAMLDAESKLPKSQFAGMQISDRPFTPYDILQGKAMFTGDRGFVNSGPACISCHTLKGAGALGGGRLGPDLTRAYERLQGRKSFAAWLFAPPTPTMTSVFKRHALKPEEILPLVAVFEDAARQGGQDDSAARLNFFLLGLAGSALALVLMDLLWKRRFRNVRRMLVENARRVER
jgi:mono/diheme cytochrome c family protein